MIVFFVGGGDLGGIQTCALSVPEHVEDEHRCARNRVVARGHGTNNETGRSDRWASAGAKSEASDIFDSLRVSEPDHARSRNAICNEVTTTTLFPTSCGRRPRCSSPQARNAVFILGRKPFLHFVSSLPLPLPRVAILVPRFFRQ